MKTAGKAKTPGRGTPRARGKKDDQGLITISVWVPAKLARWVKARAKAQGHGDISVVVREAMDRLLARHRAGLPLTDN
jgi:hypothetical protein